MNKSLISKKLSKNQDYLNRVIRIQSIIRGFLHRKKFKFLKLKS